LEAVKVNEQQLIADLRNKNQSAFEVFVKQNQRMVYNLSLSMLGTTEDAEDISQEIFIDSFNKINSFQGDSKISTWLYRITVNKCLDEIRKRKRKMRWANFIKLGTEKIDPPTFDHPGIELENKERASLLLSKIDELPDNQRVAFTLSKIEGLPYQEIADIMHTSVSAVESYLVRAKKGLQVKLQSYYEHQLL